MQQLASCLGLWLFLQLPYLGSGTRVVYKVQEEQPPNTLIGSLAADYGFPDMGHLYKLEVGAPYLRVDGKTGDIYTTETSIDRESLRKCQWLFPGEPCFLEFEISITDLMSNRPRLLEGQIEVLDINDNTPNFASPVIALAIPENTKIGMVFPIPLAMDRDMGDNGVASYELMPGSDAQKLFSLRVAEDQDEKLPQLIVMGNLDREQSESYDLTIKVQDGGSPPRASTALLHITILDMNDNAPKFEKSLYEAELLENSPIGHSVLQVKANDSDQGANAEINYYFHHASSVLRRLLQLDRASGVITVQGLVDHEDINMLKFSVIAKDRGDNPKTAHAQVMISIKDVNDNAPVIISPSNASYKHILPHTSPGQQVMSVGAEDIDSGVNAELQYSITGGNPFELFNISPHSGNIALEKEILRKHHGLHRLVVRVSDKGKPSHHGTALVHFYINETLANHTLLETLVEHSLDTPLDIDIAADMAYKRRKQHGNILFGVIVKEVYLQMFMEDSSVNGYQSPWLSGTSMFRGRKPLNTNPGGQRQEV
ncbi:protocadherin-1-like [Paroedura picta]|uniref:protocadherin-1-like n=1 Tax=Paroedura picta TaxID=143630 RepID=UPI0040560AA9